MNDRVGALLLLLLGTCLLPAPAHGQSSPVPPFSSWASPIKNEFGPFNALCRGACGPDCPGSCEELQTTECISATRYLTTLYFQCGTHEGCRVHDQCLDECFAQYDPETSGFDLKYDFYLGDCQKRCHEEANEFADGLLQSSDDPEVQFWKDATAMNLAWVAGHGPNDGKMTFAYTRETSDGDDWVDDCPVCSLCEDSSCRPDPSQDGCEPVNIFGDPHIVTPDGLAFDFHATGDFLLAGTADGRFRLAGRFEAIADDLAITTGLAATVQGRKVEAYFGPSLEVLVDGSQTDDGDLELAPGAILRKDGARATLRLDGVGSVLVERTRRALQVGFVPAGDAPPLRGLLGEIDGEPANDLPTSDGALEWPLRFEDFYQRFAGAWRLTADQTPFSRPFPADATTPQRIQRAADYDSGSLRRAERACGALLLHDFLKEACLLDVAATGDTGFAEDAVRGLTPSMEVVLLAPERPAATGAGPGQASLEVVHVQFPSGEARSDLLAGDRATDAERPSFRLVAAADGEYFVTAFYLGGSSPHPVRAPNVRLPGEGNISLSLPAYMTGRWVLCVAARDGRDRPQDEAGFDDCLGFTRLAPGTSAARPEFSLTAASAGSYRLAWQDMPAWNAEILVRDSAGTVVARTLTSGRAEGEVPTPLHAPFNYTMELRYAGPLVSATASLVAR